IAWVLTALTGVLVGAMWFLFLYSPTSDEIEETRSQTDQAIAQTSTLRAEAARLRQVRESAPEAEAQIAAAQALLPDESSMPSLLRQLQTAADEAGATLLSVQPSQPVEAQDENVS